MEAVRRLCASTYYHNYYFNVHSEVLETLLMDQCLGCKNLSWYNRKLWNDKWDKRFSVKINFTRFY